MVPKKENKLMDRLKIYWSNKSTCDIKKGGGVHQVGSKDTNGTWLECFWKKPDIPKELSTGNRENWNSLKLRWLTVYANLILCIQKGKKAIKK